MNIVVKLRVWLAIYAEFRRVDSAEEKTKCAGREVAP